MYYSIKHANISVMLLLLSVFALSSNGSSYAQMVKGDQEIAVSCGIGSFTEFINFTDFKDYIYKETYSGPIYSFIYRKYINDHLAIGLTGSTQTFSFNYSEDDGYTTYYKLRDRVYNLVFGVKIYYKNSRISGKFVHFYQLYDLGVRYTIESIDYASPINGTNTTDHRYWFNSQITPFGISMGRQFSGFVELGIGYKGLICGGLCYKISKKKSPGEN